MPTVQANGIDIYYEIQGAGEPIVLIPYLAADQACYAFQVSDYAKHFTCFTVDLRGAGLSLGAATGMWLAARHPERVKSLSLHSAWPATDPFLRAVVESWRIMAEGLGSVTEMVIKRHSG